MLDGARLDELVAKAVPTGSPLIGITDHGNMYGALEFFKESHPGIKPVIGTEAYMAYDHAASAQLGEAASTTPAATRKADASSTTT